MAAGSAPALRWDALPTVSVQARLQLPSMHVPPRVPLSLLRLRAPSVSGILNTQLSIPVNRARGTPEAQVAQLQVDTLSCGREQRPDLPLSKQGCGNGDAKCDVGRCVKGKHSRGAAAETEAELSACSGCRRIDTLAG